MHFAGFCILLLALCVAGSWAGISDFYSGGQPKHRAAREVPEPSKIDQGEWWKQLCCGNGSTYNPMFVDDKLKKISECQVETTNKNISAVIVDPYEEPYSSAKAAEKKSKAQCQVHCVYHKFGFIDNDGNINGTHIKSIYSQSRSLVADWMRELSFKAVDKCVNVQGLKSGSENSVCNPAAHNLKHCLFKEMVTNCPVEHQYKSDFCDSARDFFKSHSS